MMLTWSEGQAGPHDSLRRVTCDECEGDGTIDVQFPDTTSEAACV